MNTNLAHDIVGLVTDENDRFYFVQKDGQTYALDKSEGEHALGESVKGFAYTDMKATFASDHPRSHSPSGPIWLGDSD